jgi:hypothetical protein
MTHIGTSVMSPLTLYTESELRLRTKRNSAALSVFSETAALPSLLVNARDKRLRLSRREIKSLSKPLWRLNKPMPNS